MNPSIPQQMPEQHVPQYGLAKPPTGDNLETNGFLDPWWQRHCRYQESVTRQTRPIQHLLSVIVGGISKEQRYNLVRNYYNLRLELFQKHMHELKAGLSGKQYSRLARLVAVDVGCLIRDECTELSASIEAWNTEKDCRLINLEQRVYEDYKSKTILVITGRRIALNSHRMSLLNELRRG